MPRGGARPGAGRRQGSKDGADCLRSRRREKKLAAERALEIRERLQWEGDVLPLDVMLRVMRVSLDVGDIDGALEIAKFAAPYIHPRLQAVAQVNAGDNPLDELAKKLSNVARGLPNEHQPRPQPDGDRKPLN